jgi:hypothetical protein
MLHGLEELESYWVLYRLRGSLFKSESDEGLLIVAIVRPSSGVDGGGSKCKLDLVFEKSQHYVYQLPLEDPGRVFARIWVCFFPLYLLLFRQVLGCVVFKACVLESWLVRSWGTAGEVWWKDWNIVDEIALDRPQVEKICPRNRPCNSMYRIISVLNYPRCSRVWKEDAGECLDHVLSGPWDVVNFCTCCSWWTMLWDRQGLADTFRWIPIRTTVSIWRGRQNCCSHHWCKCRFECAARFDSRFCVMPSRIKPATNVLHVPQWNCFVARRMYAPPFTPSGKYHSSICGIDSIQRPRWVLFDKILWWMVAWRSGGNCDAWALSKRGRHE